MSLMLDENPAAAGCARPRAYTEVQRLPNLQKHSNNTGPGLLSSRARHLRQRRPVRPLSHRITTRHSVSLSAPSVFHLYGGATRFSRRALFVGISQSANPPTSTLRGGSARCGATTMGITNVIGSPLFANGRSRHPAACRRRDQRGRHKTWTSAAPHDVSAGLEPGCAALARTISHESPAGRSPRSIARPDIAERARAYTFCRKSHLSLAAALITATPSNLPSS